MRAAFAPTSWWRRYWFRPAPLLDLAVCRIVIVGYHLLAYFHVREGYYGRPFEELTGLPDALYDPLPVLHAMVWPLGWNFRPPLEMLEVVFWVSLVAGVAALIGLLTNLSLLVLAVGSLFMQAHYYSYGDFHHPEAAVLIALLVLAVSPAGRVLSLDAWARGRRRGRRDPEGGEPGGEGEGATGLLSLESPHARWPLLLIGWVMGLIYLSAAVSKVRPGKGLEWLNGYTLQYSLVQDGLRWGSDLGVWLGQQHALTVALSWTTVLFEYTFFLILIFPVLALVYIPLGTAIHVGIQVIMRAHFMSFIALYVVFVPWTRLLRRLRDSRRIRSLAGDIGIRRLPDRTEDAEGAWAGSSPEAPG